MPPKSITPRAWVLGAALLTAVVSLHPAEAQQRLGPFADIGGSWSGDGTITVSNGASERIRCRAHYVVGPRGDTLHQNLRCASDSYKFEVRGDIVNRGGELSGTWSEVTRQVTGSVSGRVSGDAIMANISGNAFSATLAVTTRGNGQAVSITPQGTDVTSVNIRLSRV